MMTYTLLTGVWSQLVTAGCNCCVSSQSDVHVSRFSRFVDVFFNQHLGKYGMVHNVNFSSSIYIVCLTCNFSIRSIFNVSQLYGLCTGTKILVLFLSKKHYNIYTDHVTWPHETQHLLYIGPKATLFVTLTTSSPPKVFLASSHLMSHQNLIRLCLRRLPSSSIR